MTSDTVSTESTPNNMFAISDQSVNQSSRSVTLQSAQYTLNDPNGFNITPGENTAGIHNGQVFSGKMSHSSSANIAQLDFQVGRENSPVVAQWYMGLIGPHQNTFGENAKSLNFAFLGQLVLTVQVAQGPTQTVTFSNVGIAQGHVLKSNNWWFGSQNAKYVSPTSVNLKDDNGTYMFNFFRGQDDPNAYTVVIGLASTNLEETEENGYGQ